MISKTFGLLVALLLSNYFAKSEASSKNLTYFLNETSRIQLWNYSNISSDLRIYFNISLVKAKGELLHVVVKKSTINVLTLNMQPSKKDPYDIRLEFKGNISRSVNLRELCDGDILFRNILIELHVTEKVYLKCNNNNKKLIDKLTHGSQAEQRLYDIERYPQGTVFAFFANTSYKDFRGCISNININGIFPIFNTKGLENRCVSACRDNYCNTGICNETYNIQPICDCENADFAGQYCNESLQIIQGSYEYNIPLRWNLKVSWVVSSNTFRIINIFNNYFSLEVIIENRTIYLIVIQNNSECKYKIFKDMVIDNSYTIRTWYNKVLHVELYKKGISKAKRNIICETECREFHSLRIRNTDEYKLYINAWWLRSKTDYIPLLGNQDSQKTNNTIISSIPKEISNQGSQKTNNIGITIIGIIVLASIVGIIFLVKKCKGKLRNRRRRQNAPIDENNAHSPLNEENARNED